MAPLLAPKELRGYDMMKDYQAHLCSATGRF